MSRSLKVTQFFVTGGNVHAKDKTNKTPLMFAQERFQCELTADGDGIAILDYGSSVNASDEFGRFPIHYAQHARVYARECCELLLQHGADVNSPDVNKETPLHLAASQHNGACTEWLLLQGANLGALDRENRTTLHEAAYWGCRSSLELLIEHHFLH